MIDRALGTQQTDMLFTIAHDRDRETQAYCFEQLGKLDRLPQARLLAKLLTDESIVPAEVPQTCPSLEDPLVWNDLLKSMVTTSYRLLGESPPKPWKFLDLPARQALAARLQAVR